jgi:DNA-binding response OmpR family regulator
MKHVLIIEPNTVLARTYTQALQHAGYHAVAVSGAQTAIDAADAQPPDLVIIELQLAAHSGIEFLHEFRSYAEWQHIPVIVHTLIPPGRLAAVHGVLAAELGIRAVLYKPRTSLPQLLRHVREQLPVSA